MMKNITPITTLEAGTKIRVGNKEGVIVSAKLQNAIPCGKIIIHTVKLTHKIVKTWANNYKSVEIKPQIFACNYSSILVNA